METVLNNSIQENLLMSIGEKGSFNYIILEKFLTIHKNFAVGSNSYINYKSDIKKIYKNFEKNFNSEVEMLKGISIDDMENFFTDIKLSGKYKPSSFNRIRSSSFEYFKYLQENRHLISINIMDVVQSFDIKDIHEETRKKYIPSKIEVIKLIDACDLQAKRNYDYNVKKNKAILSILANCGMRPNELLNAKTLDLIEKNNYFVLFIPKENCKTGIDRRVSISGKACKYLKEFLLEKKSYDKCYKSTYLIPSQNGNKIATTDLNHLLNQLKEIAEIKVANDLQFSIYCLRHFTASNLVKKSTDPTIINSIMGWSNKEFTMLGRYSNHHEYLDDIKAKVCNIL